MFKVFVLVWLLLKEKFNHDMKWYFQREERAQRTLMLPPSGKNEHYKNYRTTILRWKEI